ncbi:MAG TPA: hypothetical protein H9880_08765 [Candidatus Anaerobutyricum avicola]|nr:hypothetical protein [Candidatus Anaerobutyricum avicola]
MSKIKSILKKSIKGLKITVKEGPSVTLYALNERKNRMLAGKNEYEKWIEQNEKYIMQTSALQALR